VREERTYIDFLLVYTGRFLKGYTTAIDLPGEVGAIEVPEGGGLLEGEGLRDLDDTSTSGIGGEVGNVRCVFGHPVLERSTEVSLGPAWVDSSGGDTLVFEGSTPFACEHVKGGLGDTVGVELVGHHKGDLGGGKDGADEDDGLLVGLLDERKEGAGDAEGDDSVEGHLLTEGIEIQVLEFGQGLRVLSGIVDEVVETVGEERGDGGDGSVNAGLAGDF